MKELVFKWRFKNKNDIYYDFSETKNEFLKKICSRYRIEKEDIVIIDITKQTVQKQVSLF